jgi:hypothetical protein
MSTQQKPYRTHLSDQLAIAADEYYIRHRNLPMISQLSEELQCVLDKHLSPPVMVNLADLPLNMQTPGEMTATEVSQRQQKEAARQAELRMSPPSFVDEAYAQKIAAAAVALNLASKHDAALKDQEYEAWKHGAKPVNDKDRPALVSKHPPGHIAIDHLGSQRSEPSPAEQAAIAAQTTEFNDLAKTRRPW